MTITIDDVKQLRNKTGVSIMQCKKALEEAEGDMEKALINLTKKSGEIAAKKGDRDLKAGVVSIVKEGDKTVVLELACETDFVANNEEFGSLAQEIAGWVLSGDVSATDDEKITARLAEATQKFGERTEVVRFDIVEGTTGTYVHSNNLIAAVVAFDGDVDETLALINQLICKKKFLKERLTHTLKNEYLWSNHLSWILQRMFKVHLMEQI